MNEVQVSGDSGGAAAPQPGAGSSAPEHGQTQPTHGEGHEPEAYQPNYKFKAYDREGEFDEWSRPFIKDKETEERFRSLYAKSHGFDQLKERYKSRSAEFDDFRGQHQEIQKTLGDREKVLNELKYLRDNDLHGFFEYAAIPFDKLTDYVQKRLEYIDAPAERKQEVDQFRETQQKARQAEMQLQETQQRSRQQAETMHRDAFYGWFDHPEVSGFAEQYDAKFGADGAFEQAVIEYGHAHELRTGETLTPIDAIRAVYKKMKPLFAGESSTSQHDGGTAVPQGSREGGSRPAVIPTVGRGSTASPTKKVFTSIEDIKAHAKTLRAES